MLFQFFITQPVAGRRPRSASKRGIAFGTQAYIARSAAHCLAKTLPVALAGDVALLDNPRQVHNTQVCKRDVGLHTDRPVRMLDESRAGSDVLTPQCHDLRGEGTVLNGIHADVELRDRFVRRKCARLTVGRYHRNVDAMASKRPLHTCHCVHKRGEGYTAGLQLQPRSL